jgi:cysteinyl-tRNA synthetase
VAEAKERFEKDMDDDLNVPQALASIFELVRETNKAIDEKKASEKNLHEVYEQIMEFDRVLGVLEKEKAKEELAPELKKLIMEREKDRKSGDFGSADKIRKELAEKGIILEDNPEGPRWRRAR